MSNSTSLALRDNKGKPELSQVDPILMEEVARVLEFGAKKYARNNWRKGQPVTKLLDSGMRHMAAILRGEDIDPESGCKHWAHVCCNMMFLGCQEGRRDLDDRYKREEKKTVIREQVGGGGGGKVVDKKEGDDFLTRLRNSQRLHSMGVEENKEGGVFRFGQQGDEIEVRNEVGEKVGNPFTGRNLPEGWEEAQEKSRMDREEIMTNVFKEMREEEDEYPPKGRHFVLQEEEEEEETYDDLDSQNPPSPPGTPTSYTDGERLYYQGIKPDITTPPLKEENKNQLDPDYVKKIVDRAQERKKFTNMVMEEARRDRAERAEEKRVLDMINRGEKYTDASETPYDDMFPEQVTYESDDE